MITPAGRPCRVMTISSSAASRRYFDRSSLTLASATALMRRAFLIEPALSLLVVDDREDFDCALGNVIKHPDLVDSKPVLWLTQAAQPLDAALARLGRLESKVALKGIPNFRADTCRECLKSLAGVRRQHDLEPHSG